MATATQDLRIPIAGMRCGHCQQVVSQAIEAVPGVEAALVAIESGMPQACVLADVFHLHKGGSGFTGLKLLGGPAVQVLHMNDYPASPARDKIRDEHRVYPGDGVAPLTPMLRELHRCGVHCILSLELFNRDYWKQDAHLVAKTGLEKMRAAVARAMAS